MKKSKVLLLMSLAMTAGLMACNGGGNNGGGGGGGNYPLKHGSIWDPNPYSCPSEGRYNGVLYSQLAQPSAVSNGILAGQYPNAYLPTFLTAKATNASKGLQIAYGRNDEANVAKISAYVTMGNSLCSATPVRYESSTNTTYLIGAAHCFADHKSSTTQLESNDLVPKNLINVYYGVSASSRQSYPVTAIYLRQDYCYGDSFTSGNSCSNFSPSDGVSNGQGNDIAVIQMTGEFGGVGNHVNYPHVAPAAEYPATNSLAPILSIGYGVSTQAPLSPDGCSGGKCSTMYYVSGYQYASANTTNESGYHYLYNSYYSNANPYNQSGYTALICGGDSGGGDLFWTGSKWILLSEHTYGPSSACGLFYNYLPNGATNVSAYYDWITSIFTNFNPVASCKSGAIANCVTNG